MWLVVFANHANFQFDTDGVGTKYKKPGCNAKVFLPVINHHDNTLIAL